MGKNHRHQKALKSEKAKVKLKSTAKAKGSKQLPKGLNITDASFKVKKIVIREQLKQQDSAQILSRRKLNVKDLLVRLQHYNSSVRQDAIRELKEILSQNELNVLNIQLNILIKGIAALALDKEKPIRREALKALNLILSPISKDQIQPFCNILISYLTCAMTHIDHNIMEDSLLFLDVLLQHCNTFLASKSHKILTYFLDMISKLRTQAQPGRLLTTTLNSKNTSIKWRIKVLNSLQQFLSTTVQHQRNSCASSETILSKEFKVTDQLSHFPIHNSVPLQVCTINFEKNYQQTMNKPLDTLMLQSYIESLMPLMFDSWLEVCPKKQTSSQTQTPLSEEASSLLKCIASILQSIIEYIEILDDKSGKTDSSSKWLKVKFHSAFIKNLMVDFPYTCQKSGSRPKRFQGESEDNNCLEQNLTLAYIFVWFTTVSAKSKSSHLDSNSCSEVLQFLNGQLENWPKNHSSSIPHLIKVLKVIFLKASGVWYKNKVLLTSLLQNAINVYIQKKDLHTQIFGILKEVALDHNLDFLHREQAFVDFVKSLPPLLLNKSISYSTIVMLNRVVLQYRQWIQKELEQNHEAIIENAKSIQILGSDDEQSSRLMICNLFYFINEQIYY